MFQGEPELHFILNVPKKANASFCAFIFCFMKTLDLEKTDMRADKIIKQRIICSV